MGWPLIVSAGLIGRSSRAVAAARHPRLLARIRPMQLGLWSFAVALTHGTVWGLDRNGLYADASRQGAPQAGQIADRFHLIQNLRSAIEGQLKGLERPVRGYRANPGRVAIDDLPLPGEEPAEQGERQCASTLVQRRSHQRIVAALLVAARPRQAVGVEAWDGFAEATEVAP
jgi:hypothetical protein